MSDDGMSEIYSADFAEWQREKADLERRLAEARELIEDACEMIDGGFGWDDWKEGHAWLAAEPTYDSASVRSILNMEPKDVT